MSFGIGIIGAGAIGNVHAEAIERVGLNITGTWDVKPEAARKLAEKHEGTAVCASIEELLARTDVEAVVIAIPNHDHAEAAIAALKAGKDVLLEKPMAMNVAECDAIIETMNQTDRLLQMGFVMRQTSVARMVKQFIDEGQLGDLYHIKASVYRRRGIPGLGGWFTTKSISGGGALIDLGVHVIDLAMHLAGHPTPQRVSGAWYSTFGAPLESYRFVDMWAGPPRYDGVFDVDDAAHGLVRFDNDLTLDVNATWAMNLPEGALPSGMAILGTKGGCFFDLFGDKVTFATEQNGRLVDVAPLLSEGDMFAGEWEAFKEAVENRSTPVATAQHGRAVQSVVDALYESGTLKREVEVR